jgi:hypothetical protein
MSDDINVVIDEVTVSDEDQNQLATDFEELGISKPEDKQVEAQPLTPEEEDDRREDALHQDKSPEEREAIRERRRVERQQKKQHARDKEESYRREIDGLRKQLEEVNTWKNTVEKRNISSGIAQIDKGIQDANEALELARQAMAQATQEQNGQAHVDATELYYAARKRAEDLGRVKQTITQRMAQKPAQNLPDAVVVNQVKNWMKDKTWYDVRGRDPDSQVVQTVERGVASEGWDPRQPEYWQEVDNRIKKYLPHRFANAQNASYTGSNSSTNGGIPRPPTESSSQTASKTSTGYRLSPDRVRAIKESGNWDDPKARREMIQSYMDYDKQQR